MRTSLIYLYPRERSSGGYIEITLSVRLSDCPSVCADSCPAHKLFCVWHWLSIFVTWVYQHETMCRVNSWSRYDLELSPKGQIYRVLDMFLFCFVLIFLVWHWLTIFGTWVYHHKMMRRVHSWSRFDVDHRPQGQKLLSCLHVRPVTSVSYDIGIPYLAHGSLTKRARVKYIHDPDTTLTFDLRVKITGFMT